MKTRIQVVQGDITQANVDVIVNAANPSLQGGGGVDGAIHRAAGPSLLAACQAIHRVEGDCATGHAVITEAGNIAVNAIIHTVGPVWQGGGHNEAQLLAQAYSHCLNLAAANGYASIAFPTISTGAYGYPLAEAAEIAWDVVYKYLGQRPLPRSVVFVCFDQENYQLYQQIAASGRYPFPDI